MSKEERMKKAEEYLMSVRVRRMQRFNTFLAAFFLTSGFIMVLTTILFF